MSLLDMRNVFYAYPEAVRVWPKSGLRPWALNNVSLKVNEGDKLALLGANGSGKSTLLLHMNGLLRPTQGQVLHQGIPLDYGAKRLNLLRQRVSLVFQDSDSQLFAGTLYEDVSYGPLNLGLSPADVHDRVRHALAAVGLEKERDLPLHLLSFGQRKRAALAGALAMRPQLLVLDEPTAGLDPRSQDSFLNILDAWVAEGCSVVFSTHDVDLALAWSSRVAIMGEGQVLAQGHGASLLGDAAQMHHHGLRTPYALRGLA